MSENEKNAMNEADKIIFGASVKVTDELKICINTICDLYKEFMKNGLKPAEAALMIKLMFELGLNK